MMHRLAGALLAAGLILGTATACDTEPCSGRVTAKDKQGVRSTLSLHLAVKYGIKTYDVYPDKKTWNRYSVGDTFKSKSSDCIK